MESSIQHQHVRTVWWEEELQEPVSQLSSIPPAAFIGLLDQTQLPQQVVFLRLEDEKQVAEAIQSLRVRGAPAIGVTAAFGVALALRSLLRVKSQQDQNVSLNEALAYIEQTVTLLGKTRPTAVNLFWALQRMQQCTLNATSAFDLDKRLVQEALLIAHEDAEACLAMGRAGASLIADGDTILTHCNAGALATSGIGSALAPIYTAFGEGKRLHIFVDETRPILQGARLTAWELQQAGIPLTLITDTMAGYFMQKGRINAIFVGADRIAANGDVANKIGTYSLAVLAHVHRIPFYVVAPCSTIDLSLPSGEAIPIEQRASHEITSIQGIPIAPVDVAVANPAFDVTPSYYISAIITEKGIAKPSYSDTLRQHKEAVGIDA